MFTTIAMFGGLAAVAIALPFALHYVLTVRKVNALYRDVQFATEDVRTKAQVYWKLEHKRRRSAAIVLVAYAVLMLLTIPVGESKEFWHIVAIVAGSLTIAGVSLTATFNNMRQQEIRIEAEAERRYSSRSCSR